MRDIANPLKVIQILSDGQFHSGEDLATIFGITRAGINKYIKVLREWGIELKSVQKKGYQLYSPMELLDKSKIEHHYLASSHSESNINLDVISVIDSTNLYLLNNLEQLKSGDACVAEYQTAGRARRGRKWFSPFGSNLYLSMYWRLEQGPTAAMGLSLVIGIVVADILSELSGQKIKVKWPNDLYLEDKKLAGILVEITGKAGDVAHVVMGMGINVSMHNPDQTIVNQAWTNLGNINRNQLVAKLLVGLRQALPIFEQQGLAAFIGRWQKVDNFANRSVKLFIGDKIETGIARGINQNGALLIEQNGQLVSYMGGEISLRADDGL